MTRDRDIERVLERWFTEGPTQMPDHLFNVVVDRIDRVPQRRLAGLKTRLLAMNSNLRLAAAAAVIVVVAGAGVLILARSPGVGVIASPSPIVTPGPSPTGAPLPAALQHYWIGETRTVAGMVPAPVFSGVVLSSSTMRFDAGGAAQDSLFSNASLAAADRIRLVLINAGAGCGAGDEGIYRFVLSPGAGYLSLVADREACAARSQAISGDWVRSDCPDKQRTCLGDLEAGHHVSSKFTPFARFADWKYNYGRFGYTVPDSWANPEEDKTFYVLAKQATGEDDAIWLLSDVVAHSQDVACPEGGAAPGIGRTASALSVWLTTLPGLTATPPQRATVGGLSGYTLDVSVAASWKRSCPGDTTPTVALFADAAGPGHDFKVQGNGRMRLFLLDLGDGRTLLIDVWALDKATFDALVAEAMPVVQTFQFSH